MNKSYSKPSTILQSLRLEGNFMSCSTRVDGTFEVKALQDATFDGNGEKEWNLSFDE